MGRARRGRTCRARDRREPVRRVRRVRTARVPPGRRRAHAKHAPGDASRATRQAQARCIALR
ncbi:hypothetical protein EZV77_12115 [Burkholderia thailandensis]|nr:hypothetical protein A8H32_07280 [Burkholderia thailandensis]PJO69418.1 hypothetical protein CWD92_26680 [Burkholderia thailandensis]TBW63518.1 hypothetical protein EZV77_12115 [Burkholderia thailandensis]TGB33686.1 hypothetical protein C6946_10860 [Burkholderia thailandensis]